MSDEAYFFDSYALFEIIKGNPKYEKYSNSSGITTIFNLAELNYGLKKDIDIETADDITDKYSTMLVETHIADVKEATNLRTRKRDLSLPDVIGFVVARKHGLKFLTGDEAFRKMPNVEFVKK